MSRMTGLLRFAENGRTFGTMQAFGKLFFEEPNFLGIFAGNEVIRERLSPQFWSPEPQRATSYQSGTLFVKGHFSPVGRYLSSW